MLTSGNANLLMVHGTPMQQEVFAKNEFAGRFSGTMCLSEPQAGSCLSRHRHARRARRRRISRATRSARATACAATRCGSPNGEHELTENIIHLVLAKIPGDDGKLVPGTRGISLFIVPEEAGRREGRLTGERNDVVARRPQPQARLSRHPNTLLNFGEGKYPVRRHGGRCRRVGYLVGQPGEGLRCMFHMMNEARIGVGLGATMLGFAGYDASLDYAKSRPQGRPIGPAARMRPSRRCASSSTPTSSACCWRRRLLRRRAGARALLRAPGRRAADRRRRAGRATRALLLEVLTPIAKSWPSEWCLEANSLAIQVLRRLRLHARLSGRAVLARQPPQHDPRGHARHPGARPARPQGGDERRRRPRAAAPDDRRRRSARASSCPRWPPRAGAARTACTTSRRRRARPGRPASPHEALANATPYLQAFGHVVLAWIWLDVALPVLRRRRPTPRSAGGWPPAAISFATSCRRSAAWLGVVETRDDTCRTMAEESF